MYRKFFFILTFLVFSISLMQAQDYKNEVLLTIDGKNITAGEFERIYRKNNNESIPQKQSVEEYLEMFINFKLKVAEAENLGMDTAQAFLSEFGSYRDQLAQPYLTDPEALDHFAKEAYERMKKDVHARHIMVSLDAKADPRDTLYAYNKAMDIRESLIKGEDFEKVARAASDDPSAKTNGGDLGWFSVFKMVLPFEDAAYNTPVGKISMPVRSQFGYHILKVDDMRPARGSYKAAHIYIRTPPSMTPEEASVFKEQTFAIYDSLKNGYSWDIMVSNNSDDKSSTSQGGELPWASSGQMIPEFENAVYELSEIGKIHQPVQSDFGWHIIKLLEKKEIGSFEEERPEIISQFSNGPRDYLQKQAFTKFLKSEYNYKYVSGSLEGFYPFVDNTVFSGDWDKNKITSDIQSRKLFTSSVINGTYGDFASYIVNNEKRSTPSSLRTFIDEEFKNYVDKALRDYEDSQLENKYPEFGNIVQEYHDGILLFDLTDKKVWSAATIDTVGLEKYYRAHAKEYLWPNRVEAYTIIVNDSSLLKDAIKLTAKNAKKKKFSKDFLLSKLCPEDTLKQCIDLVYGKYEKGENEAIDNTNWIPGLGETFKKDGENAFVYVISKLKPSIKKLEDTRGQVTADYQTYLESKWIDELRGKYEVKVNKDILKRIKE